jgi:hypothetical protein
VGITQGITLLDGEIINIEDLLNPGKKHKGKGAKKLIPPPPPIA